MDYRFPTGLDARQLVQRLKDLHWQGEIIGPHGSGKSTLLKELIAELNSQGREVRLYSLRDNQRQLPVTWTELRSWSSRTQLVVDGYEQLYGFNRILLRLTCWIKQTGLLVTTHRSMGLPCLIQTSPSFAIFQELVHYLVNDVPSNLRPSHNEIETAFSGSGGNLREAFLALYDVYQRRQQNSSATNASN